MSAEKAVSISFRVSQEIKAKLEAVPAKENRNLTNMLEALMPNHCQREGVAIMTPGSMGEGGGRR